ncbi:16137_t:CDS:2 [Funneliformis caledonium]|uniref:16137_t:CDS:1 n=1 Tax=Funneliformis caledonium TaxID=1117310 RepID=A0A9N9ESA0_9GLOM|nr:16137_t:CDS:2 [Funneliformis caledonium]
MGCNKYLPSLSQNLIEILDDDEYYDIIIEVGKDSNIEVFRAHMVILYIYGGHFSIEEYHVSGIVKVLEAVDELGLPSFEHESLSELQKFCTKIAFKEPGKIFTLSNYYSIPEKLLVSLIQHENLKMSDAQVWEHVLKWGISRNPRLFSNPSNYSIDDFVILRNTIQHCVPFIRFYNLTFKEFLDKVSPYEKILPVELYKGLLKKFMNPNNHRPSKKFESTQDD